MLNSTKLTAFLERQFPIKEWRDRFEDDRPNPKIPPATIAQIIAEMPLRRQTSILEVDQDMREEENILWHRAEERNYPMVASDTTIFRSLRGMDLSAIKSTLQEVARRFLASPHSKVELPTGRKVRVGSLDGTCWGRYPGSVLSLLGEGASDQVAHYRISPGTGHERATSRAVEETACRRFGEGYIDYLAKDALYMTESDIKRARKNGYDLVVKTEDNSLNIIKKARTAFYYRLKRTPMDLKEVEGVDAERGCKYKITCTAELTWQKQALKVARIKETYFNPKPGHPEQTDYWVLTTDLEMDPHDMREVKILRWNIENRTFRLLSRLTESKHKITEDEHTRKVLLGLWFIGVNLFGRVRTWLREPQMKKIHQTTRRTWKWHTKQFIRQVHRAAYRHRNRKTG